MLFCEDQHRVGDFGPGCEHEPFRIAFALGLRGGITTWLLASARTASNDPVNCPALSRTRNRKPMTRSPDPSAGCGSAAQTEDLPASRRMTGDNPGRSLQPYLENIGNIACGW
jgi:hypothetical protein